MISHLENLTALGALVLSVALLSGCEKPPAVLEQQGYRGTGMVSVHSPAAVARVAAANAVPAATPAAPASGVKASTVYQNVKVLGDADIAEFTRLMTDMTAWVSPQEGCGYCHNLANLADDSKYTKVVARRMLEMTRHINNSATSHVAATGVTCFTCHRGMPVPANIWHNGAPGAGGMLGYNAGQNAPAPMVGLTSLPGDPFSGTLASPAQAHAVRVAATQALPGAPGKNVMDAEHTYGLMMHFSAALGANCTTCHNTRSFADWTGNPPRRVTAWHGLQMVRDLNENYLTPLTSTFPASRLGPTGDAPKVNCATCHQGAQKPLLGVSMLQDYPILK